LVYKGDGIVRKIIHIALGLVAIWTVALLPIVIDRYSEEEPISSASSGPETLEAPAVVEQASLSRAEARSRDAAVKVINMENRGHGSGTYFAVDGHHIVITAAHVIAGSDMFLVSGRDGDSTVGSVIYKNAESDFAVILIPEMTSTSPIALRASRLGLNDLLGERIFYTGYPASHDRLFVYGVVTGFENNNSVAIMHSYAWPGSSGSGVFDRRGRLVGLVMAVDVNEFVVPQLTEDIVWVTLILKTDLDNVFELLNSI
jgi:S1-C subfamily serine protease